MENCPPWLDKFIRLARPGSMVAMFALLVIGGLIFATVELFAPTAGERSMRTFIGFLAAIDSEYYETLRFMFGAYVIGRSGQDIASSLADAQKAKAHAEIARNTPK